MSRAGFAYAQARLHARLEARLTEEDWQMLAGSRSFGNCLDVINQTAVANVTSRLDRTNSVHAVERVLRVEWDAVVSEISDWLPEKWKNSARWLVLLPYLRRFEYLPGNNNSHRWLRLNIEFGELTETMRAERKASSSILGTAEIWCNEWSSRLPDKRYAGALGADLKPLFGQYLGRETLEVIDATKAWQELVNYLKGIFRKHPQTPVAIFAYLGLIALDIERLRGVLVDRIIFAEPFELEEV